MRTCIVDFRIHGCSHPVLHCTWLYSLADLCRTMVGAMLPWTINRTVLPATPHFPGSRWMCGPNNI